MDNNEIERALRWQSLVNLGNQVKLKWSIDHYAVEKQLEQFNNNWCPYNAKKEGFTNAIERFDFSLSLHAYFNFQWITFVCENIFFHLERSAIATCQQFVRSNRLALQ